jgi:hypothetical protein
MTLWQGARFLNSRSDERVRVLPVAPGGMAQAWLQWKNGIINFIKFL